MDESDGSFLPAHLFSLRGGGVTISVNEWLWYGANSMQSVLVPCKPLRMFGRTEVLVLYRGPHGGTMPLPVLSSILPESCLWGKSSSKDLVSIPCTSAGSCTVLRSSCPQADEEQAEMGWGWAAPWGRIHPASYSGQRGRRGQDLSLLHFFAAAVSVAPQCAQSWLSQ